MCYFDIVVRKCYFREDMIIIVVFVMDIIFMCILGEKNYYFDLNIVVKLRFVECVVSLLFNV